MKTKQKYLLNIGDRNRLMKVIGKKMVVLKYIVHKCAIKTL